MAARTTAACKYPKCQTGSIVPSLEHHGCSGQGRCWGSSRSQSRVARQQRCQRPWAMQCRGNGQHVLTHVNRVHRPAHRCDVCHAFQRVRERSRCHAPIQQRSTAQQRQHRMLQRARLVNSSHTSEHVPKLCCEGSQGTGGLGSGTLVHVAC